MGSSYHESISIATYTLTELMLRADHQESTFMTSSSHLLDSEFPRLGVSNIRHSYAPQGIAGCVLKTSIGKPSDWYLFII